MDITASLSINVLIGLYPKHGTQIPLPHLKWDIDLAPESEQKGKGSEKSYENKKVSLV